MHEKDETRKKGSTDSGLRSILTVTRGGMFLFFARCRSLAAAWRVLVAVVSSRKEIRAQAREVRMASSATRADQGAQDPRRPNAFPEANDDGRFAGSKLGLSETSQPH